MKRESSNSSGKSVVKKDIVEEISISSDSYPTMTRQTRKNATA
jgi:hypothetical protein